MSGKAVERDADGPDRGTEPVNVEDDGSLIAWKPLVGGEFDIVEGFWLAGYQALDSDFPDVLIQVGVYGDGVYGDIVYGDGVYGDGVYGDGVYGDGVYESV